MNPYLLKAVGLTPQVFRRLVARFPADAADTPLGEDRFTLREVIAHLADWEPIFGERLRLVNEQPGILITVYDESDRAVEQDYASADIAECLDRFEAARAANVAFLQTLPPDAYLKPYRHPELGDLKLEDQANMLLGHDLYHVEQIIAHLPG